MLKVIGYDASPRDQNRQTYARDPNRIKDGHLYDYWYPLQEWGWDREQCKREIAAEGLPVPPKSSCIFCAAMQIEEVAALPPKDLRRLVRLEARARPRFTSPDMKGLWGFDQPAVKEYTYKSGAKKGQTRRAKPAKPGSMTQFILDRGLLPATEVQWIIDNTPREIVAYQQEYADGLSVPPFGRFMQEQLIQIKKGTK